MLPHRKHYTFFVSCRKQQNYFGWNFVKLEGNIFMFDQRFLKFDKIWLTFHNNENFIINILISKYLEPIFSIKKYTYYRSNFLRVDYFFVTKSKQFEILRAQKQPDGNQKVSQWLFININQFNELCLNEL